MKAFLPLLAVAGGFAFGQESNPLGLKIAPVAPGSFRLDWQSENHRGYTIEASPDLVSWADAIQVFGNGSQRSQVMDFEGTPPDKFFWRVREGAMRPGFDGLTMARSDDWPYPGTSSDGTFLPFGFTINFYGVNYAGCYVSDNGKVNLASPYSAYDPMTLMEMYRELITPFWADSDTRTTTDPGQADSGQIRLSSGGEYVGLRKAWGVTYRDIGYFRRHADKRNSFQVVFIDRSDTGAGNFDLEYNYDKIQWDSGDDQWGDYGGIDGQTPAIVGMSAGDFTSTVELDGSDEGRAFLDRKADGSRNLEKGLIYRKFNSDFPGRLVFPYRNGRLVGGDFVVSANSQYLLPSEPAAVAVTSSITPSTYTDLEYQWRNITSFEAGLPPVTFSSATVPNPTVTLARPGNYSLEVVVKRALAGGVNVYSRSVCHIAHSATLTVSAGVDWTNSSYSPEEVGNTGPSFTMALNGSGSFDGGPLTFTWTAEETPWDDFNSMQGIASFSNPNLAQPNVTLTGFGLYRLRLTVSTLNGFSKYADIWINYRDTTNDP